MVERYMRRYWSQGAVGNIGTISACTYFISVPRNDSFVLLPYMSKTKAFGTCVTAKWRRQNVSNRRLPCVRDYILLHDQFILLWKTKILYSKLEHGLSCQSENIIYNEFLKAVGYHSPHHKTQCVYFTTCVCGPLPSANGRHHSTNYTHLGTEDFKIRKTIRKTKEDRAKLLSFLIDGHFCVTDYMLVDDM